MISVGNTNDNSIEAWRLTDNDAKRGLSCNAITLAQVRPAGVLSLESVLELSTTPCTFRPLNCGVDMQVVAQAKLVAREFRLQHVG